jgi:secondary thiamine-phosphate synthase enzyme
MKEFLISTRKRQTFVDITKEVSLYVRENNLKEGLVTIFVPHTTAGVTINENADPDVVSDILLFLGEAVPEDHPFKHDEGNSDAHIKASFMGASVSVPVNKGKLMLGVWQSIYFAEFDGPRNRKFNVILQNLR